MFWGWEVWNYEIITQVGDFTCMKTAIHNVTWVWSDTYAAAKKINQASYRNHALTELSCVEIFNQVSKKLTRSTL